MMGTAKVFVCGDLINMYSSSPFIDKSILNIIAECDYSICNFEGTCEYSEIKGRDMVHLPETLPYLKQCGLNMLLLGNNHITDYGYKGLACTLKNAKKFGFDCIGAGLSYEACYAPFIKEINGIKFGFINLCEAQVGHFASPNQKFGYAWLGDSRIDNRIRDLRGKVDYLLLFLHAGLENYELPLPQFRNLYHHYCNLGADIIIGGHPHISQGIEEYNNSIIFYSLGNFYFPKTKNHEDNISWSSSYSVMLEFSRTSIKHIEFKHRTIKNIVSLDYNSTIDIERLSKELEEPFYSELISKQNITSFYALPYKLYREALNGADACDSVLFKIKYIINYLLNRRGFSKDNKKRRLALLRRLVENETYRFLTMNAIEDLTYKQDDNKIY